MMFGRMKKELSSFMVAVLMLSAVSMIALPAANAADPDYEGLGSGTLADPYQISTPLQLDSVRYFLEAEAYFILTDDIDLGVSPYNDGEGWVPIGTDSSPFNGYVNGNGYKITNLTIDRDANNQGLFGYTHADTKIKNMALEQVSISNISISVGSLVGWNKGEITDSYANGVVDGFYDVGGLVGVNEGAINNSYTEGDLLAVYNVGGLVGRSTGAINNSYSIADVAATVTPSTNYRGGLVGVNEAGTISNSYATGLVRGVFSIGGLVGENTTGTIIDSYATGLVEGMFEVGGLVGLNSAGSIDTSYYDSEINGMDDTGQGEGLSTTAMKQQSIDMGWDYSSIWKIDPSINNGYPTLRPDMIGGGTELYPYQIAEAYQLDAIRNYMGTHTYFILTADIDLDVSPYNVGEGWEPITHDILPFMGSLDGNGHTISGLMINRPDELFVGFFEETYTGAEIKNLKLTDVDINAGYTAGSLVGNMREGSISNTIVTGTIRGQHDIGGLVGQMIGGSILDAHMLGEVSGTTGVGGLVGLAGGGAGAGVIDDSSVAAEVSGNNNVGGLVGQNSVVIDHSYATGNVRGSSTGVGGLVGANAGTITYSYATGNVKGSSTSVGGLVGGNAGTITHSYATGEVTSDSHTVGGLVGYNGGSIENSYATGNVTGLGTAGGLVGYHSYGSVLNSYAVGSVSVSNSGAGGLIGEHASSNFTSSYYKTNTTLQIDTGKGEGKSTLQMMQQGTYVGWDFTTIWGIASQRNNGYPYLRAIQLPVTYDWNGSTGGTVPLDGQMYIPGVTATVYGNIGNLTKTGYSFAGWNTEANGNGTSYAENDTFPWTEEITLYAQWVVRSNDNTQEPQPQPPTDIVVDVLVNGKPENAGITTTSKRIDQTVITISVDQKKLEDRLATEAQGTVVTILVDTKTDVVVVELNGRMVKNMEEKQTVLEVKSDRGTYTLPALQIDIDSLSNQFGKSVNLQDIQVQIEISEPTTDTVSVVEDAVEKGSFTLVVPPLSFTVRAVYEGTTVEVTTFDVYVERTIAIPEGIDPSSVTTAVVVDPDGTVRHVPTEIVAIEGKYYARINSLTNSTYAVISHPLVFMDVTNHWAEAAVNDMGSRMVIDGTGNGLFSPDRDITRAEFAAIIVRGLGLKPDNGATAFSDVKTTDWYISVINTAYTYDLINGFEDGTFRPNDKITREQAMVILSSAMSITGLKAKLPVQSTDMILRSYKDVTDTSTWAQSGIADSVQSGIISGRSGSKLAPKADMTRAEVAAMIHRLLRQSGLI